MTQVVQLVSAETAAWRKHGADVLRDFADKLERGEISNIVIAANNRDEQVFEQFGHFEDRWHILGALEHAKSAIFDAP